MIWVGPFFGDHAEVEEFFGIPHAEGAEAHAGLGGPELMFGAALAATEAEGDDHGDKAAVDPENLPVQPGEGAIYMHPSNHTLDDAHHAPKWVKVSPFIAMLLGFGIALSMYMRGVPVLAKLGLGALGAVVLFVAKVPLALAILGGVVLAAIFLLTRFGMNETLAANQAPLYRFFLNKWYFDEIYDATFVRGAKWLGRFLWKKGDGMVIDGTINGVAMEIVPFFTRLAGRAQSGYMFHYAAAMVLGIVIFITWMTLCGGAVRCKATCCRSSPSCR